MRIFSWILIRSSAVLPPTRRCGWRAKEKWEGFEAFRVAGGGGVDHVPQSTLRRGRGNKGGLFSLSVLAGRLFSPLSSSIGGLCRVMPEEIHNRDSGVEVSV